jgi:ABC-type Fe3+ transport system substrate-binding protein
MTSGDSCGDKEKISVRGSVLTSPLRLIAVASLALAACSAPTPASPAATNPPPAAPTTAPAAKPTQAPTLAASAPAPPAAPAAATPPPAARSFNQADWDKVVEAARKEGSVVITSEPGTDYQRFVTRAQEALPGIKIEHTGMRPSDFVPRALAEQKNGQFLWDLAVGPGSNMLTVMSPAGALENSAPFVESLTPDVTDESKWSGGFMVVPDPRQPTTFVFQYVKLGGIYVNRDKLPVSEFNSAAQLLDPKFKGKIGVYKPDQSTGGSQTLGALLVNHGPDFLNKLIDVQGITKVEAQRQNTEWLATGRVPIAMGVDRSILKEFQDNGIGKNVERLEDGSIYLHSYGTSVIKNPPHPNATKVFLNWFLSQQGQDLWASTVVDANSRRVDVHVYNPDSTPDYDKLNSYKFRLVTPEGSSVMSAVFAAVKGK